MGGAAQREVAAVVLILAVGALVVALGDWPSAAAGLESFARALLGSHYPSVAWFVSKSIENVSYNFFGVFSAPVTFGDRLHWVNIVGFIVFAAVAFLIYERSAGRQPIRRFFGYLFPLEYYRHSSSLVDYQVFLINRIFTPAKPITRALSGTAMAGVVMTGLTASFGPPIGASLPGLWAIVLYTLLVALVVDVTDWATHAVMHRVPALWEFHKLHHSAEVLTPMTVYRIHPAEQFVGATLGMLISGTFSGVMGYLLLAPPALLTIFGVGVVMAVFQAAGSHLRHSHIWLSWGPLLSRIVISPAQHQIHHSVAPAHWDKNYGFIFAFWDWLFGTLYVPKEREQLKFGLSGATRQIHPTVWAAYLVPFLGAWQVLRESLRVRKRTRSAL
jgi:sterol desaturase/sphingolipid hydroxylase (fatty acid hydroxylase superfamily)